MTADIGDIADVPEDHRLDVDEHGNVDTALPPDDDLADIYADPGELVEL